jgi:uncharacterized phiE125 gp8 family phage protein
MALSLSITAGPASEPVSVAEVKQALRLTTSADDSVITRNIKAAREFAEKETRRSLAAKSYLLSVDRFPYPHEPIRLPVPPLVSVTSIKFLDSTLTQQTWDSAEYFIADKQVPALIVPKPGFVYPSPVFVPGAVEIAFISGVDPSEHIKEGIRQLAVHIYEHPEAINSEGLKEAPLALIYFFRANKIYVF